MGNPQAWLTLTMISGLGPAACRRIVEACGGPRQALAANRAQLSRISGLRRDVAEALVNSRDKALELAAAELDRARNLGIHLLCYDDPLYPSLLKEIHNPPVVLYVKGELECLTGRGVAVVGSRAATGYGRQVAAGLTRDLARAGFTIVSGLALGIDTEAHRAALAQGGKTLAVLGCGLDIVYPEANRWLFQKIPTSGAIISEYPLSTKPDGFRFPARNRIISGLSLGVVVVEAAPRSGSLITAQHALEQGREIFAIPGRVDSYKSSGTHALLKQGAKLVQNLDDILEELPPMEGSGGGANSDLSSPAVEPVDLAPAEMALYEVLEVYPRTIDEIVLESGLPAAKVSELLLLLELKGLVETLPGKSYKRVSG